MTVSLSESPGIGKLLIENRFAVPNHQRDYSWTEEQIKEFFIDITEAFRTPDRVYFMGLMVFLAKDTSFLTVLDGQQRLATAVILYSAIRRWLRENTDLSQDADEIQRDYIGRRELGEKNLHPRLALNAANDQTFSDHVINASGIDQVVAAVQGMKRRDRNRRLAEAVVYIDRVVAEKASTYPDTGQAAQYFFGLINFMRDKVGVVKLVVPTEDMAYTIFETLNDRGLELSPLDLVKNYLFGKAAAHSPVRLQTLEERWAQMMQTLSSVRSDNFLKVYWTSRHGRIRTRGLFTEFKDKYKNQTETNSLSIDMLSSAEQYSALENADDPVWAAHPEAVRKRVRSLKNVSSQQVHPVMLSALARLTDRELERVLRLLEVVIVRYMLVGGGNTGNFETTCAILARKIYAKEITTANAALLEIGDLYVPDVEFKAKFETKEEENTARAQYFLRNIEIERQRIAGKQMGVELEPGSLTIEHVLPKNPDATWSVILARFPNFREDFTHRLGNMCLLSDVNRKLGNKNFKNKVDTYRQSRISLTSELGNFPEWQPACVVQRQKQMALIAASVWRFQ